MFITIIIKAEYILVKDSLSSLHTSINEPHLTYYVEVWDNAYKINLNFLYGKQKSLNLVTWVIQQICFKV